MRYIKKYEKLKKQKYSLTDIENIDMVKDDKFLTILDFYVIVKPIKANYIELNIPIDLYYSKLGEKSIFTTENIPNSRHFYHISGMWMHLDDQHFKEYKIAPNFLIDVLSEESQFRRDWSDFEERFIIMCDDPYCTKIVDAIYNYVKDHEEIIYANKFNI